MRLLDYIYGFMRGSLMVDDCKHKIGECCVDSEMGWKKGMVGCKVEHPDGCYKYEPRNKTKRNKNNKRVKEERFSRKEFNNK